MSTTARRRRAYDHPVIVIGKAIRDATRLQTRASKLHTRLKAYGLPNPATAEKAQRIAEIAQDLQKDLQAIPKNWQALRGSIGNAPIEIGDEVSLKKEAIDRYDGLISKNQVFRVDKIVANRLRCMSKGGDGLCVLVTRSNVVRVGTGDKV